MIKNNEISVLAERIEILDKSPVCKGLSYQYEKQEENQPEIYEVINQLAYSSELSNESRNRNILWEIDLEKCYCTIEVATRETVNIYHLIIALSQCEVFKFTLI